jgi:hypothetical protein
MYQQPPQIHLISQLKDALKPKPFLAHFQISTTAILLFIPSYGRPKKTLFNFPASGVPNPVTGSHPFTAVKPFVPQP